jgi:FkbM family methyltransferase
MKSLDDDESLKLFSNDNINYKILDYVRDIKFQTIIHLGSNNGIIDILLCQKHSSINIYAFEPRDEYFTLMKNNMINSKCENIHLLNNTLSHTTGEIKISQREAHCSTDDLFDLSKNAIVNINTIYHGIRIDDLFLLNCDLMILELDLFNKAALCGAFKTIEKFKPVILFTVATSVAPLDELGIHFSMDTLMKKINYVANKLGGAAGAEYFIAVPASPQESPEQF